MAGCFCCDINLKFTISVKENLYLAYFAKGEQRSASNHPNINLSPSYSEWSQPGNQGLIAELKSLDKFSVQISEDGMDWIAIKDRFERQLCFTLRWDSGCCGCDKTFWDNQGNEMIRFACERNPPQGRREIGYAKLSLTFTCYSATIHGTTSDFYLKESVGEYGRRFKSSKTNEEIAQVFTAGKGVNGYFPTDLDLGMKIGVISEGVNHLRADIQRRNK